MFLTETDLFPFMKSDLRGDKAWSLLLKSDCSEDLPLSACYVQYLLTCLLSPAELGAPQGREGVSVLASPQPGVQSCVNLGQSGLHLLS